MRLFNGLIVLGALACGLLAIPKAGVAQDLPDRFDPAVNEPLASVSNPPQGQPATQPSAQGDLSDSPLYDCACGCGIFEVGTSSMLPTGMNGLMLYLEYDYMDQNKNWSGDKSAPPADNGDKEIRTSFLTPGLQYFFNRSWGIQAEVMLANRYFKTTGGASGNDVVAFDWNALGDTRLEGIYSGFFPDQSLGVTFGAKLPTGRWNHNDDFDDIDRDSEIGTGSTDALLGGYYRNNLTTDGSVTWFAQLTSDIPILFQDGYRPGAEADAALGVYLNGLSIGRMGVSPLFQVLDGLRGSDTGAEASSPIASGYERVLVSPGLELNLHPITIYGDVEIPVYARVIGNQLIATSLFKIIISYHF